MIRSSRPESFLKKEVLNNDELINCFVQHHTLNINNGIKQHQIQLCVNHSNLKFVKILESPGANPEILKRSGALCRPPQWSWKKILGFTWSKKAKNNVRNYKFLAKYFQHFQIFSIFIYNESLQIKSYHFFKICKCFDKEREKTLMQQSMRKEKLRKVDCSIKFFNMIINHFCLFRKLIRSPNSVF